MRTNDHLAVGSPTVRVAAVLVATMLLAVALAAAGVAGQRLLAASHTIVVAQDGSGDYATIGEAVDAADDGHTILVRPGSYAERVAVVGKDLVIRGDGDREAVVIEAIETSDETWSVLLQNTTTRLANLTVTGPYDGEAISVQGTDGGPTLDGIVIRVPDPVDMDYEGVAVHWAEGSEGTLQDSLVEGTVSIADGASVVVADNDMPASCIRAYAVGADITIRGNRIRGCPYELGITLDAANTAVIEGNDIMVEEVETPPEYWYSGGRIGIELTGDGQGDITIRDNDIHDSRFGIQVLEGSPAVRIVGNRLRDNGMGLARIVGSAVLSGNTITGSEQVGIELREGTPTLEDNTVRGNFVGLSLTEGSSPRLAGNTICENATNVRLPDGAQPLESDGNEICEDGLAK